MKIIKKFIPVIVGTRTINDRVEADLSFGNVDFSYGYRRFPPEEFETEELAIEHAYKTDQWATWTILPIIRFDNFE